MIVHHRKLGTRGIQAPKKVEKKVIVEEKPVVVEEKPVEKKIAFKPVPVRPVIEEEE